MTRRHVPGTESGPAFHRAGRVQVEYRTRGGGPAARLGGCPALPELHGDMRRDRAMVSEVQFRNGPGGVYAVLSPMVRQACGAACGWHPTGTRCTWPSGTVTNSWAYSPRRSPRRETHQCLRTGAEEASGVCAVPCCAGSRHSGSTSSGPFTPLRRGDQGRCGGRWARPAGPRTVATDLPNTEH
jgi:hypothetical protein